MSAATSSVRQHSALLVGLAYAAFVSLGLPDGLTSVAWPSIRTTFGLPLDALGALIVTSGFGYLVSSFTSGRALARLGVGWLLALSCLATTVSLLGYGAAPLWGVMVALGLLAGLGAGAIDAGLNTYAAESFSPRTLNWLHASFGLGASTGPIVMSSVIGLGQSWRLGYLIVGVAQLALTACFVYTRREWHAHAEECQAGAAAGAPMLRTLRLPSAWLSMLLFFLYTGLEFGAGQWLYTLLTEARGLPTVLAGIWVSVYWGSLTVGRLLSGALVERISVRTLLQLSMLGAILGVVLLWLNLAVWLSFIGVALLGLSLAPMFPSFIALTPGRMGPEHAANTVGFQVASAMLGGTSIVGGFGLVASRVGLEALGPYLLVVALLLAGVFELLERRTPAAR